jgi:hypothetical protein
MHLWLLGTLLNIAHFSINTNQPGAAERQMSQTFLAELSFSFLKARDVAYWHKCEVPRCPLYRRYRGISGSDRISSK